MTNTYYVPIHIKELPDVGEPHKRIGYYQWVPLILLVQAVLFYLPAMVWRFLSNKGGIDIQNIIDAAMTLQHSAYTDRRNPNLTYMVQHMDRYLTSSKGLKDTWYARCKNCSARNLFLFCGRRYGNYVTVIYLIIKLLYMANVIGQLFMLNAFLGDGYHVYGYTVLKSVMNGDDYGITERFPRVTLCDFHVRKLGNIQRHTVQCVLPINLFNEKIYIFIWFWMVFVALMTALNFITWLCRFLIQRNKISYVRHHLGSVVKNLPKDNTGVKDVKDFVLKYLKHDGILVLRLLGTNANNLAVAEILGKLWEKFRTSQGKGKIENDVTTHLTQVVYHDTARNKGDIDFA